MSEISILQDNTVFQDAEVVFHGVVQDCGVDVGRWVFGLRDGVVCNALGHRILVEIPIVDDGIEDDWVELDVHCWDGIEVHVIGVQFDNPSRAVALWNLESQIVERMVLRGGGEFTQEKRRAWIYFDRHACPACTRHSNPLHSMVTFLHPVSRYSRYARFLKL